MLGRYFGTVFHKNEQIELRLRVWYAALTGLCSMMIMWIIFMPGSCRHQLGISKSPLVTAADNSEFQEECEIRSGVPTTIISKYVNHRFVCYTHILPAALWSLLIPFQFHPASSSSQRLRVVHRITGKIFLAISTLIIIGLWQLEARGLSHYKYDFPEFQPSESASLFLPNHIPSEALPAALVFIWTGIQALYAIVSFRICGFVKRRDVYSHQRWIARHAICGLGVALQRLCLFALVTCIKIYHGSARYKLPRGTSKAIFGDASVIAMLIGAFACEWALVDLDIRNKAGENFGNGVGGQSVVSKDRHQETNEQSKTARIKYKVK
eukprot:jgi/Bigna1/37556/e_gw1.20.86.1